MTLPIIQPSFLSGEIAPRMRSRVDLAKYHSAVALGRNVFVEYKGGLSNRPGTLYVGRAKDSSNPVRVIPFQFSTVQTYALEFGHQYMRVILNGGYALEAGINIINAQQLNPCEIDVVAHPYSNGDTVAFSGVGGMVNLNTLICLVANATPTSFTLTDLDGNNIDATNFPAFTNGGTVSRVYTLATPYAGSDLALLKFVQSADTMTLTHQSYAPRALTRTGHTNWTLNLITFAPTMAAPGGITAVPKTAGTTNYRYVVTAVGNNGVTESVASAPATAASVVMSTTAGAYITVGWNAVTGAIKYNIYRTEEYQATTPPTGAMYGYVGSADSTATNFIDENITPDFTLVPPFTFNPFSTDFPGVSTYFQGRQFFGGSPLNPQTIWGSRSADFYNMNYSSPARANDGLIETLNSVQVNAIKHLVPMSSLIVLTAKGAWRVDGGTQSDVITPASILAVSQATNGASDVRPLVINYDVLYVQSKGSIVRDLHLFNFFTNIYTGDDLSVLSSHLFSNKSIVDWDWAEEPYRLVWAVRSDGVLLSLTYLREQEIYGWTRHDTLNGKFESVCSISEGLEDAVYFVVRRLINGKYVRFIERLASRNMDGRAENGWFLDCARQTQPVYPNATITPAQGAGDHNMTSVIVAFGGSGYINPTIYISDPDGFGAQLFPVLANGVIVSVTVIASGKWYVNPTLNVVDVPGGGSGAVLNPVITDYQTMTVDSAVLLQSYAGQIFRGGGGRGTIISVANDGLSMVVDLHQPFDNVLGPVGSQDHYWEPDENIVVPIAWPLPPNAWNIAPNIQTIIGLDHLNGQTVSVLGDGGVQSQEVVVNGSITIDAPASLITVGLPIRSQIQTLTPELPGQATVQSARQKISGLTIRVAESRGLKVGPTFDSMYPFRERTVEELGFPTSLITGDERQPIDPMWQAPGKLCFQQDDPLPFTLLAVIPDTDIGDVDQ